MVIVMDKGQHELGTDFSLSQLDDSQINMIKQNIIKNITVVLLSIVFAIWVFPYVQKSETGGLVDSFLFLSIFPLGAMFAYFAFNYKNTNMEVLFHRMLADVSSATFLLIICCSITFATVLAIVALPNLTTPFVVLSVLLIMGCVFYDFWDFVSGIT